MKDAHQIIDLTHSLTSDIPSFDGDCCFSLHIAVDYKDCESTNLFRVQKIEAKAGAGTHMDAPAHCFPKSKTIEALDLANLVTECIIIRVDDEANETYVVMPDAIKKFEEQHGKIEPNTFVIFYTGWDKYWGTPKKYRNDLQFPSVHEETAKLLLKRDVAGIGIDTLSPDAGGKDYPVHRVILGSGKYLVENVANAEKVPPTGAKIMIMPMKIKDGTEAPIRMIAVV